MLQVLVRVAVRLQSGFEKLRRFSLFFLGHGDSVREDPVVGGFAVQPLRDLQDLVGSQKCSEFGGHHFADRFHGTHSTRADERVHGNERASFVGCNRRVPRCGTGTGDPFAPFRSGGASFEKGRNRAAVLRFAHA